MWLCKSSDYATMIMVFLADHHERMMNSTEIAEQLVVITPSMVVKLLKQLARAKLLVAERGNEGGYRLARPPQQITLADVISAVEDDLAMTECAKQHSNCQLEAQCHLRSNWLTINQVILTVLRRVSLLDMRRPLSLNHLLSEQEGA